MYSKDSFQIGYRRKIYEQIALLAYNRRAGGGQFRYLPGEVAAAMGAIPSGEILSSDLDYAAEAVCAALGLEPAGYSACVGGPDSLEARAGRPEPGTPLVCVLRSACHRCAAAGDRPCMRACARGAISLDRCGRTCIDAAKCDSCGKCLEACPYGAVTDKSSICQVIRAIASGQKVCALLVPAFSDQFRRLFECDQIPEAFRLIGFSDVAEAAPGADLSVPAEDVPCACGAWRSGEPRGHRSCAGLLPGVAAAVKAAAAALRADDPGLLVTLVVPCAVRKLTAERALGELGLDYVLAFEEVLGMMDARGVDAGLIRACDEEELVRVG